MPKYLCQAQSLVEKTYEAVNEEDAEMMMSDYMMDEYADGNWVVSVYEEKEKCWHPKGCRFNSNNSFGYMKCLHKDYSVAMCEADYNKL